MKKLIRFFLRHIPRKYLQRFVQFTTQLLSVFYIGNKVECPVCGKHYRKFLPYGYVHSRENALCQNCLALERHRLMWLYLKQETNFFSEPAKLLHVAPEHCFIKRFEALPNIDYITADLESPWAKVKMDVQNIPFEENTFDIVFCNHIMEHVDSDLQALSELYRVMKPNAWGIILSPINPARKVTYEDPSIVDPLEREKHFGQKDHLREYGLDYAERLSKCGFQVEENHFSAKLPPNLARRYALQPNEKLYIVRK